MALEFKLPDIGEGVAEGEIVQWLVKPGDAIKEDQAMVEIMTDKVTAEIPSPCTGVITELRGAAGDVIAVGTVIAVIDTTGKPAFSTESKVTSKELVAAAPSPVASCATQALMSGLMNGMAGGVARTEKIATTALGKVLAAPATRKLATTMGVALTSVPGTGERGRVTPDDVRRAAAGGNVAVSSRPSMVARKTEQRKPFSGIRKKIAEHLTLSKHKAPHFAYVEEIDVTELVKLRSQVKVDGEQRGIKLTYLPFIVQAVVSGLKAFPMLNSTLDETTNELVEKHYYNIGIATDTPNGLVVPVIPHAETLDLWGIASAIQATAEKARSGKLTPADMTGGTFTLTSIGSMGGLFGIPIINFPEVGILGINRIVPRPVVRDGQIVVRDILYLSLSCDHRVVDGADGARFINHVKNLLEQPYRLLMG
ncbi:MAG: dihydrolipoamide acetyltransferase family protein [Vampirovibrionales bacterium]|nr:dihydrolipoamide acetyltransferase family protein [Vampirovibrionales bacterium]